MEYQILALFIFILYMIPTWVAERRKHKNTGAILFLNLLLGWTFIGWVIAFVWACTSSVTEEQKAAILARAMADEMQRREEVK